MRTLEYDQQANALRLIDQVRLPSELQVVTARTSADIADAIRSMRVRGAPVIGVAGAYGVALGAREFTRTDVPGFLAHLEGIAEVLKATRPTAVSLAWAVERAMAEGARIAWQAGVEASRTHLLQFAHEMAEQDVAANRAIGRFGLDLIPVGARILTHCNTGSLATVDYGTALGVVRAAHDAGRGVHVLVDETRPFLQGARLTTWELQREGIPQTLITDSMAGHFMQRGRVDLVLVGADRIAANGDTANKIGTYSLGVLAREHGLPFYVAAPTSTVDLAIPDGQAIPIEERSAREVVQVGGVMVAPEGVHAAHPAFDITPHRFITAIVTERGVLRAPFEDSLRHILGARETAGTR